MKVKCVFQPCSGQMSVVATSYGYTGGDKWQCDSCESYVVTRPEQVPTRPDEKDYSVPEGNKVHEIANRGRKVIMLAEQPDGKWTAGYFKGKAWTCIPVDDEEDSPYFNIFGNGFDGYASFITDNMPSPISALVRLIEP